MYTIALAHHPPLSTFAQQFEKGRPGQGASDLQPLRHHSGGDELVVRDFFVQLVISRLVEEDQVVELVPHLSFGPLLLQTKERKKSMSHILTQN